MYDIWDYYGYEKKIKLTIKNNKSFVGHVVDVIDKMDWEELGGRYVDVIMVETEEGKIIGFDEDDVLSIEDV